MLDYRLLEALEKVGTLGSFERAANALGITQSAISQRISTLEQRVGILLVKRDRPVALTDVGLEIAKHVSKVKLLENELINVYNPDSSIPTLKIVMNADSLSTWWHDATAPFLKQHNVAIEIITEDQSQGLAHLQEGSVVACICSTEKTLSGTRSHYIGSMTYRFYCSPEFHQSYFSSAIDQQSLNQAPAVLYGVKDKIHEDAFTQMGLEFSSPRYLCPSSIGMVKQVASGSAYGALPTYQAAESTSELVDVFPDQAAIEIPLYWHYWREGGELLERLTDVLLSKNTRNVLQASNSLSL
ncbi:ArgP/LysG family DNA-binding transcriptional regulator [Marinomonas balearica]|uniref:LysR family transcriptional regulator (Chromosome initiation inhibitor) n=1 Tax=Marinomonas balearica TaxID=491947 RepID=A0A4R6M7G3_9GAMM|nr:ArgP/LysG family DNA-binding transcriptional regulator [Marinomonas balearica]TDO97341.1 LysR family transcriptional regulator (chromosome initiation inhibitor) [Marinomonas balearica]